MSALRALVTILMVMPLGMSTAACSVPHAQEHAVEWDGYQATVWLESDEQQFRAGGDERFAELQQITVDARRDVMDQHIEGCAQHVTWYVPATMEHFSALCSPGGLGCSYSGQGLIVLRRDVYEDVHSYVGNQSTYIHELVHITGACAGDSDPEHDHVGYWERTERSVFTVAFEYAGLSW